MTTRSNPFGNKTNNNPSNKISAPFGNQQTSEELFYPPAKNQIKNPQSIVNEPVKAPKDSQIKKHFDQPKEESESDLLLKKEYERLSQYNSSPLVVRPTFTSVPSNLEVFKEANTPFAITINPLSKYIETPVIQYENDQEIPRCDRKECKAYISPFVKFIEDGDKWICNFCRSKNITQNYYYEKLDNSGDRIDRGTRPEISLGSYEFIANSSYINKQRPQVRPTFIFLIDVSLAASVNGYLTSVVESIKSSLNDYNDFTEDTKIAIITFDTAVHFYNLDPKLTQPELYSINESNIFLPLPENQLLVSLDKSRNIIMSTLDMIQNSFNSSIVKDSNKFIEAIDSAYLLGKGIGGKVNYYRYSA